MLFLLPPSETKRDGGSPDSRLEFDSLSFQGLDRPRRSVAASLIRLSKDADATMAALKIGPRLAGEVERNRRVKTSPTLPALERYTGVAFDPIDATRLDVDAHDWAASHLAVHSALFGLVAAGDRIPAYRLSHDSRLPGVSLRALWQAPIRRALAGLGVPVVDLRSEGYVELGPAPAGSAFIRIVSDESGRRRALNHFNKKTKGLLVRRLLDTRPELSSLDEFVDWARGEGVVLERPAHGEIIVVSESVLALKAPAGD